MALLRPIVKRQRLLGRTPPREEGGTAPAGAELTAPAEYRAAMRGLGSAQSRLPPSGACPRPAEGPALIPPEEYVGDDWLDDDLGLLQGSRKRPRPAREEQSGSGSGESTEPESDVTPQPLQAARKRRQRSRQSRLTRIVDRIPLGRARETGSPERPAQPSRPAGTGGSTWLSEGVRGRESPSPGLTQVSFRGGAEWSRLASGKMSRFLAPSLGLAVEAPAKAPGGLRVRGSLLSPTPTPVGGSPVLGVGEGQSSRPRFCLGWARNSVPWEHHC